MRLWTLGSGSKGNALLLECGETRVVIDAGFPARTLATRLAAIGIAPESISACVMTHEHIDHVRGAAAAQGKWGWSLHASAGTVRGSEYFADAVVTDRASGVRAAIIYDLGAATPEVREAVRDVDVLVIEANHDEGMLRGGPYPRYLQNRIASRSGHLSNRASAALCAEAAHGGLNHVVLAHLSETNNDHALAATTVTAALGRTRFRGQVSTAAQHSAVGPFCARHSRAARVEQLAFAL
jgi:phosphoribosyl 1,2-cyclic phosphodiesterase